MSWFEPRVNLVDGDTQILICPSCGSGLSFQGAYGEPANKRKRSLRSGVLRCRGCSHRWRLVGGVPWLVESGTITGRDFFLRPIYDFVAPSHDLGVNLVLPLLQFPDPGASRDRYVGPLELWKLAGSGTPVRILEVGIGAGANLPLLQRHLPKGLSVEIWGVDLSVGMLLQCSLRAQLLYAEPRLRLLMADAHKLPFADASFDRVFHVGGINGYRDIGAGLAEMARVAKPGTPIVVVDEELDPKRNHSLLHRIAFDSLTWFDTNPHAPVDAVPAGATDVDVTRVSRFYYCLSFRMPAAPASSSAQQAFRAGVGQVLRAKRAAARRPTANAEEKERRRARWDARLRATTVLLAERPKRPGPQKPGKRKSKPAGRSSR